MRSSLIYLFFALLFSLETYALTYKGSDLSSLAVVERNGVTFKDNGKTTPFETILKNHGSNAARIRIWTAGDYNLNYGLALAKRVKAAGMTLIVDLHYSDTWADPGKQAIPSGWPQDLNGLNTQIYTYTQSIVNSFKNQGTPIDILQVGNEINNGLLWPVGEISVNGINPVSQLLNSAINGAKSAGALSASAVDIIGVSFYPFYDSGATLSALKSSLTNLANKMNKPIVVAETDWPVACSGGTLTEPSIPVSAAGQKTWIKDIASVLNGLPNGLGQGIFYWEPGWVGSANLGSSCSDNLLVDSNGNTRTSINIFNDM
ncbi:Arabinogalactan endo-beta-1,4-galactanase [Abortiporus biennis]